MNHALPFIQLDGQQITLIQFTAVDGDGIDFIGTIRRAHVTLWAQVVAAQLCCNHVPLSVAPLALDPKQPRPQVEDQVVAAGL